MRKLLILLALAVPCAAAAETASETPAEPEKLVSFGVESDFFSRYVWHGVDSSTGPVWQPSATIESYGFGASVWANAVLDEPSQGDINEIDYMVYYSAELAHIEIEPALTVYTYPRVENAPTTVELSLHLAYPVGPVKIFSDSFFDVGEYAGATYVETGVGYERTLSPLFALKALTSLGVGNGKFNETYLTSAGTQANTFAASLELACTPWKGLYVTPLVAVSVLLPEVLRDGATDPTLVWGGAKVGYDF